MARFEMGTKEIERLHNAIRNFPGKAEEAINDVFHNDAPTLVSEAIKRLIPTSGRKWSGKAPAAKTAKSSVTERKDERGNLTFAVGTTGKYHYLYFPDDGSNTRRHVGNQQFFQRGAEEKQPEIVDRCITKIVNNFEKGV